MATGMFLRRPGDSQECRENKKYIPHECPFLPGKSNVVYPVLFSSPHAWFMNTSSMQPHYDNKESEGIERKPAKPSTIVALCRKYCTGLFLVRTKCWCQMSNSATRQLGNTYCTCKWLKIKGVNACGEAVAHNITTLNSERRGRRVRW